MIDNRNVLPIGTVIYNHNGNSILFPYTSDPRIEREFAGQTNTEGPKAVRYSQFTDPFNIKALENQKGDTSVYADDMMARLNKYRVTNEKIVKNGDYSKRLDEEERVVIIAPGSKSVEDVYRLREIGFKVVTVGVAYTEVKRPDYHVHLDTIDPQFFKDSEETVLYNSLSSHPNVAQRRWKRVVWFQHPNQKRIKRIHIQPGVESVGPASLIFAGTKLKAKEIVLLGFEAGLDHEGLNNHFWPGIAMQCFGWWLGRYGVRVWNCSNPTTILGGVVLDSTQHVVEFLGKESANEDVSRLGGG